MKAYLFDLDGTLLDSMGIWVQIDADFLKKRGLSVPPDYVEAVTPMRFCDAAAYTVERFGLSEHVEDLMREWHEMAEHAYAHTVALKPHAKQYLQALKARGAKLAVVTSLTARLFVPALKQNGIASLFDAICSTDEVGRGKAHPDVYLLAARRLGVAPGDCVVFEDIKEGVCSAKAAGMTVYGVYDPASAAQWPEIMRIADGVLLDFKDAPLI